MGYCSTLLTSAGDEQVEQRAQARDWHGQEGKCLVYQREVVGGQVHLQT